jgi:dUTP pyrophosphatase
MQNGLWFYRTDIVSPQPQRNEEPVIRRLTVLLYYFLLHFRLAHAGKHKMAEAHLHFLDLPKATTRNVPLLNYSSCAETDIPCRAFTSDSPDKQETTDDKVDIAINTPQLPPWNSLLVLNPAADKLPDYIKSKLAKVVVTEHRFHMDFGFPRGSTFKGIDSVTGQTFTSIDGYRAYLLIIMYLQRRVWVFLTKNKQPPIEILRTFLRKYDTKDHTHKVIRSDQGGELRRSSTFRRLCCDEFGYILEPTASGTPQQNGLAERPNRTFGRMMRCLLHSAGLGPQFWSFALLHSVWIYNRLPHSTIGVSPYTAFSGKLPLAKYLRVFGCRIIVRQPKEHSAKLDSNTTTGIFLGYTATDKNILYIDDISREIKTATHVIFDEAHLTAPRSKTPPAAAILQQLGFSEADQDQSDEQDTEQTPQTIQTPQGTAKIVLLDPTATIPTRGTPEAVGFDLVSAVNIVLEPLSRCKVNTAIALTPPAGYYGQILSRSGLAANHNIDCLAGVIDPDYTGPLMVLLQNSGRSPYHIHQGDKIAQLVFLAMATPVLQIAEQLKTTERTDQGFGSTDVATDHQATEATDQPIVRNGTHFPEIPSIAQPYDIILLHEPYDYFLNIEVTVSGNHPPLGLILHAEDNGRVILQGMEKSTPGHKIPRWKSTLHKATLLRVAHTSPELDCQVHSIDGFMKSVATHRDKKQQTMMLQFATTVPVPLHPETGNPQIHQDQFNAVQQILFQLRQQKQDSNRPADAVIHTAQDIHDADQNDASTAPPAQQPAHLDIQPDQLPDFTAQIAADAEELSQTFTLKQLKARDDWPEWRQSQFKQLKQYADQNMWNMGGYYAYTYVDSIILLSLTSCLYLYL